MFSPAFTHDSYAARAREERERDVRERRLRGEMERLEEVVRSMRATIDAEEGDDRDRPKEGRDESHKSDAD
jgi:hypothetical protein